MKNYTLSLDSEQVSEIVANVMISDYQMLCNDIANLQQNENDLPEHKKQDLKDIREWHGALKILLSYYLTPKQYASIIQN